MFEWLYKLLLKVCTRLPIQKEETSSPNSSSISSSSSIPHSPSINSIPPTNFKESLVSQSTFSSFSKSKAVYETWQIYHRVSASFNAHQSGQQRWIWKASQHHPSRNFQFLLGSRQSFPPCHFRPHQYGLILIYSVSNDCKIYSNVNSYSFQPENLASIASSGVKDQKGFKGCKRWWKSLKIEIADEFGN